MINTVSIDEEPHRPGPSENSDFPDRPPSRSDKMSQSDTENRKESLQVHHYVLLNERRERRVIGKCRRCLRVDSTGRRAVILLQIVPPHALSYTSHL